MTDFYETYFNLDNPCDTCIWMFLVKEHEKPCCYCENHSIQNDIPKDFDINKLKEKYKKEINEWKGGKRI